MLSDDEMAALVGKTGAELLGSGWTSGMGYNLDSMEFYWDYAPFAYPVTVYVDYEVNRKKNENTKCPSYDSSINKWITDTEGAMSRV